MTKNEALEKIQKRIVNLIEEVDETQSDWSHCWDNGYNTACKQIIEIIKLFKKL